MGMPSHYGDDQEEEEGNYDGEESDGDDDYVDECDDIDDVDEHDEVGGDDTTIQARVTRGIAVSAPSAADVSIRLTL